MLRVGALSVILLLLGVGHALNGTPSLSLPGPQPDRPHITRSNLYAPAALVPPTSRPPAVAENRTPGQASSDDLSAVPSAAASSGPLSYPLSHRAARFRGARGLFETTCPLLCVFRC